MHLAVYWFVKNPLARNEAIAAITEVLKGYSWMMPLPGYYAIRVGGESDRQLIREKLVKFGREHPGAVQFIITPILQGKYNGFLPPATWKKLRERTGE